MDSQEFSFGKYSTNGFRCMLSDVRACHASRRVTCPIQHPPFAQKGVAVL